MPQLSRRIAGVAAAAFFGAALLAPGASAQQSAPAQPMSSAPPRSAPMSSSATSAMPGQKHSARVESRITSLHSQLKVTPDQESKWSAVADAMRDNASSLDELAQQRASMRGKMNAVDDLKSYEAIADAHAEGLKKLVPAFSSLYDSMSETQKKNADQVFAHRPATARRKASAASHS